MEMTIREQVIQFYNSKEYLELVKFYQRKTFFNIFNIARDESTHSDFWFWLLNPKESHNLGNFPLRKILETIIIPLNNKQSKDKSLKISEELEDLIVSGVYEIINVEIVREKKIDGGFIDLFITLNIIKNRENSEPIRITITIENKVLSNEHSSQTRKYYDYITDKYQEYNNIFIYLTPLMNAKFLEIEEPQCEAKEFVQLNYQHLVDFIIEPCLNKDLDMETRFILNSYLRSLSYPTIQQDINSKKIKGDIIMAISERERNLLLEFWESQKDLLITVLSVLKDDPDIDTDDSEKISQVLPAIVSAANTKDRTKYHFLGNVYPKNRLVLAVVKEYIKQNPNSTIKSLKKIFSDDIHGSPKWGIIRTYEEGVQIRNEGGVS
ncbi:MAG TPA: PD-(D/E)XK nuclease family protein, partial [Leptospiraceae bacterium]|nr:PD-(D/E)XK nuclease family protein [Leptospiraceae bacterium]